MDEFKFKPFALGEWKETRDTLLKYCRLVGAIRETLSTPLPHSSHTNLLVCDRGFTTSLIQKNSVEQAQNFEVILDLLNRKLLIESNYREILNVALTGQSLNALCDETCSLLTDIGIKPPIERPSFIDGERGRFEIEPIKIYWENVKILGMLLEKIKMELSGEVSSVQLRPDDLSLILNWYADYKEETNSPSTQEIEFGFSTGDEKISEAYLYVSEFPGSENLDKFYDINTLIHKAGKLQISVLPFSKMFEDQPHTEQILLFFKRIKPLFE